MLLFVSYLFFGWNRFSPLGLGVYPAESVEGSPTHPALFSISVPFLIESERVPGHVFPENELFSEPLSL